MPICASFPGPSTMSDMSIIIAIVSHRDLVVATDGLARKDGKVVEEQYEKSVALNPGICLASTGSSTHLRDLLARMDPRCATLDEDYAEKEFREQGLSIAGSFETLSESVSSAFMALHGDWISEEDFGNSAFLLCGRGCQGPAALWLFSYQREDGVLIPAQGIVSTQRGTIPLIMGVMRDDPLYGRLERISLGPGRSCVGAEQRLVRAIRVAVSEKPEIMINGNVLIRRMSRRFEGDWRIEQEKRE